MSDTPKGNRDYSGNFAVVAPLLYGLASLEVRQVKCIVSNQMYSWRFGNGLPRVANLDADGRVEQLASADVHELVFGYHAVDTGCQ